MKGDRDGALHFSPGDLRQILGIEDEEISGPLGTGSRHDGEQHTCGHDNNLDLTLKSSNTHGQLNMMRIDAAEPKNNV